MSAKIGFPGDMVNGRFPSIGIPLLVIITITFSLPLPASGETPSPPDPTEGLEVVEDQAHCAGDLAPGAESGHLLQVVNLMDDDDDEQGVKIIEATIANEGTAKANEVDKLEVVDGGGNTKGSSPVSTFPVTIPVSELVVADDSDAQLGVKVHLSSGAEEGSTVKLKSKIIQEEGDYSFSESILDGCTESISQQYYPIPYVVSHWVDGKLNPDDDPTIDINEIMQAIAWWANGTEVPNTGGKTIDINMILNLIGYWANGKKITESTF